MDTNHGPDRARGSERAEPPAASDPVGQGLDSHLSRLERIGRPLRRSAPPSLLLFAVCCLLCVVCCFAAGSHVTSSCRGLCPVMPALLVAPADTMCVHIVPVVSIGSQSFQTRVTKVRPQLSAAFPCPFLSPRLPLCCRSVVAKRILLVLHRKRSTRFFAMDSPSASLPTPTKSKSKESICSVSKSKTTI